MSSSKGPRHLVAPLVGAAVVVACGIGLAVVVGADDEPKVAGLPASPPSIEQADLILEPDHPSVDFYENDARGQILASELDSGWAPVDGLPNGSLVYAPVGFIGIAQAGDVSEAVDEAGVVVGVVIAPTIFVTTAEFEAPDFDWRAAVQKDYEGFAERATEVISAIEERGGLQPVQPAPQAVED